MKFLIFVTLFLSSITSCFASEQIKVSLSGEEITLGESLKLEVLFDNLDEASPDIELDIPGLDNFNIFSRSQGFSYENINGNTRGLAQYILDLRAKELGEFELGPVSVITSSGMIVDDEVFKISISGDKNTQAQPKLISPGKKSLGEETGVETGLQEKSGIKAMRFIRFPLIGILILVILFFIIFYIILSALFTKKQSNSYLAQETEKFGPSHLETIIGYFQSLEREKEILSSQAFFHKYNIGIREIFSLEGIKNTKKSTLKEIEKNENIHDNLVFKIFKKSYKHEYSGTPVSTETRQKYIDDILSYIKK